MNLYKYTLNDTYEIKNGIRVYHLKACFVYLLNQGKSIYGQSFKIDQNDYELLYKLLIYAIRDEVVAEKLSLDLSKGLLLMGPPGCGKTSFMHLLKPFFAMRYQFQIKSCRTIGFEFNRKGFDILENYSTVVASKKSLLPICFDDFGNESDAKHYGVSCNYIKEIMEARYDLFYTHQQVTHITTQLNAAMIEKKYGIHLRNKMREMFNVIVFSPKSIDKRLL